MKKDRQLLKNSEKTLEKMDEIALIKRRLEGIENDVGTLKEQVGSITALSVTILDKVKEKEIETD